MVKFDNKILYLDPLFNGILDFQRSVKRTKGQDYKINSYFYYIAQLFLDLIFIRKARFDILILRPTIQLFFVQNQTRTCWTTLHKVVYTFILVFWVTLTKHRIFLLDLSLSVTRERKVGDMETYQEFSHRKIGYIS